MNKLTSILQIQQYKPKLLQPGTHRELKKYIKFFTQDAEYRKLSWTYWFKNDEYSSVLERMNRIGWMADEIQHHP